MAVLGSQQNGEDGAEISLMPPAPTHTQPRQHGVTIIPRQCGAFVTTEEPTVTDHNPPPQSP